MIFSDRQKKTIGTKPLLQRGFVLSSGTDGSFAS
jgi:hypothetical protein